MCSVKQCTEGGQNAIEVDIKLVKKSVLLYLAKKLIHTHVIYNSGAENGR